MFAFLTFLAVITLVMFIPLSRYFHPYELLPVAVLSLGRGAYASQFCSRPPVSWPPI